MIQDPSNWTSLSPADFLLLGGSFLLPALGSFHLVPLPAEVAALFWFLLLIPVVLFTYVDGWRGTALALALGLGLLLGAELLASGIRGPGPDLLPTVVAAIVLLGTVLGWVTARVRRAQGDVETLALTDPLTGLPNQRHARVFLETVFGGAERGRTMAVALFDLDEFDAFNRKHGRREADEALQEFGELLESHTRRMNLSSRFGREEFLTVLADSDDEGSRAFADRIREAFARNRATRAELTVSAGVAAYHPSMRNPDELVAAADLALHRAKQEGRNRVRVFGRDVDALETPESRRKSLELPEEDGATSRWRYPREDWEMGRTPPPRELLPQPNLKYGEGRRILLVSGEDSTTEVVEGYLSREGFQVEVRGAPEEGMGALGEEFDAVIPEVRQARLASLEFIRATKSRWPATQVLVITGAQNPQAAAEALNAGADRYLFHPVRMRSLQSQLVDLMARRDRLLEGRRDGSPLPGGMLTEGGPARQSILRGLLSLVRACELRDIYTRGHSRRVANYSLTLLEHTESRTFEMDPQRLRLACLLHDIGNLDVPERILNKKGPLSPDEFEKVRAHPETGRRLLAPVVRDSLILAVTGWHHERWDGSGYPDGLGGEAIPPAARLVAVTDALDAMTSPRAYRAGLGWEGAVRQIRDRAGSHFDPQLMDPFAAALPALKRLFLEDPPPPALREEAEGAGEAGTIGDASATEGGS